MGAPSSNRFSTALHGTILFLLLGPLILDMLVASGPKNPVPSRVTPRYLTGLGGFNITVKTKGDVVLSLFSLY